MRAFGYLPENVSYKEPFVDGFGYMQQSRILFRYEDGHLRILTPDRHIYTIDGKRIK